jgi:membrane protein implicated in regulation of membrane protease activity
VISAWFDVGVPDWLIWTIVAAGLAAAETLSLDFILIMLSAAAAVAAVAAAVGAPAAAQVAVAIGSGFALLMFVRPLAKRHLLGGSTQPMHTDALIGREAVVLESVTMDHGLIRLNGQDWTARSTDHALEIPVGTRVVVMRIQGATAIVVPETEPKGA